MGRFLFRLPDIGEGVAEAEIVAWHVKPGDVVHEDQPLLDVMTDKATVDMTSPVEGRVAAVHGEVGAMAAVGSVLIEMEVEGHDEAPSAAEAAAASKPPAKAAAVDSKTSAPPEPRPPEPRAPEPPSPGPPPAAAGRAPARQDPILAAPATRGRAFELGIPLQFVRGTGPAGRITPEDLDAYTASDGAPTGAAPTARTGVQDVKIIGLRRKIAEKMQLSKRNIPHFGYVEECDLTELERLREELNASRRPDQPKLTLLPFFMRALVRLLPEFPQINARYDDEAGMLHTFDGVHVGVATQTPSGLMVPVIRHAETRDLWNCAAELARITAAAREGRASRGELTGSTITITSLGPLGGVAATPVINHPEVAIIGPNKLVERPVVSSGHINIRKMMNISSSFDHRIVDGYDAARFIQQLRRMLEHPALIFMDAA